MMKKCLVLLLALTLCLSGCSFAGNIPTKAGEESTQEKSTEAGSTKAAEESSAGSTESSQPETKAPETLPPETTPVSELCLSAYNTAKAQFDAQVGYAVDYTAFTEQTFPEENYLRKESGTRKYLKDGEQVLFLETAEQKLELADWTLELDFIRGYADGSALLKDGDGTVFAARTAWEDYSEKLLPAVLIDPALYARVEQGSSSLEILFSEASAPEAWLALPETAELENAEGTVTLNAKGGLVSMSYTVRYSLNQLPTVRSYTCTYKGQPADFRAELPDAKLAEAAAPEDLRAAEWMEQVPFALNTRAFKGTLSRLIYSAAAAAQMLTNETLAWSRAGQADMLLLDDVSNTIDEGGTSIEDAARYVYQNGSLIMTHDDQVTPLSVDREELVESMRNYMLDYLAMPWECAKLSLSEQGDAWLLKYTFNEEAGRALSSLAVRTLFADPELLDKASSGYRTAQAEGFLSLDKETLLPINTGLEFQGLHTIGGQEYPLVMQAELNLIPNAGNIYYTVFEENPADLTAPEQAPTPLMYRVKDKAGHELVLLGTIHVGDSRNHFLPKEIYEALEQSDFLAVECDIKAFEEQLEAGDPEALKLYQAAYLYQDGTMPEDHMSEEEYADFLDSLKTWGGWFLTDKYAFNLPVYSQSLQTAMEDWGRSLYANWGVDLHLLELAGEKKLPIREVEDRAAHMSLETAFPDKLNLWILGDTAVIGHYAAAADLEELYEAWCRGDEAELRELLADTYEADCAEIDADPELTAEEKEEYKQLLKLYNDKLIHERNAIMLEAVKDYLAKGEKAFVAVGTAHLMGEDGLVEQLTAAGCEVSPVSYH